MQPDGSEIATKNKVALIAGPTASGKSGLAQALAQSLQQAGREAVIINADASQVYRDIPILSAAPTATEMADIPHRLFGHIDGSEPCDAARWAGEAKAAIAEAHGAGAIPILVGGTGLYIDTLLRGIAPVPPIDEGIRQSVRALPIDEACRMIEVHDPEASVRLHPSDRNRISRALEVVLSTGIPLHVWQEQRTGGIADSIALAPLILLPPRELLVARCDARLAAMFAGGAVDEVATLLARGLDSALPVMRAIGVPEIAAMLAGHSTETQALAAARIATRQYAKRQYTWFRNQPPPAWERATSVLNDTNVDDIVSKLRQILLTG